MIFFFLRKLTSPLSWKLTVFLAFLGCFELTAPEADLRFLGEVFALCHLKLTVFLTFLGCSELTAPEVALRFVGEVFAVGGESSDRDLQWKTHI